MHGIVWLAPSVWLSVTKRTDVMSDNTGISCSCPLSHLLSPNPDKTWFAGGRAYWGSQFQELVSRGGEGLAAGTAVAVPMGPLITSQQTKEWRDWARTRKSYKAFPPLPITSSSWSPTPKRAPPTGNSVSKHWSLVGGGHFTLKP